MDLTSDAAERVYGARVEIEDLVVFLTRPDSIALARPFAAAHHLALGDRLELATPSGRRELTVRGLLDAGGVARAFGGNVAVMDLPAAEELFTTRGAITSVDVVVAPGADIAEVAEAITARLPAGLRVETPAQRQTDLRRVTGSLDLALRALALLGLVAAFLIAFNALSTVFEERAWQLGVLRAVGVRAAAVWRTLLAESLLVGVAGVALGLPLGIALGRLVLPVVATTSALAYKLVVPEGRLVVHPASLVLAGLLGVTTAVLAAALPAWRVTRVALAETMGSRGAEQPGGTESARWTFRATVLAVLAGVLALQAYRPTASGGLVSTAIVAVATAAAGRLAVQGAGRLFATGSGQLAGPVGRLAAASLLHNPRRTALTVATLGVGLGCVVWFWTMAASFERSLTSVLTAAVRADLIVTSTHVTNGWVEAPVSEEVADELAALPGVADVVASRVIDWPHEGRRVAVEAFDARYFTSAEFGHWPLAEERIPAVWEYVARGEAAIVSSNFLSNFHAHVGDPLVLATPTGPLTLVIGGSTAAFESPAGTIQLTRELFRRAWHDRRVNRVGLRLAPGTPIAAVQAAIARDLVPAYDLRVLTARDLVGYYAYQVRRAFAPLGLLAATVLLVTLVGLADTLLAAVLARRRELGTVRAIGLRRAPLARMMLVEALLLGGLGLGLAVTSGLGLAALWVHDTLPHLLGWVLDLYLPLRQLPALLVLTVAVAAAAAFVPARRAARLEPGLALRQD